MITSYEDELFMAKMATKISTFFGGYEVSFVALDNGVAVFLACKTPNCKEKEDDLLDAFTGKTYVENKDGYKYCIRFSPDTEDDHCFQDSNLFLIKAKYDIVSTKED